MLYVAAIWLDERLTPQSPPPTITRRIDSASLSSSQKPWPGLQAFCWCGQYWFQFNWIANLETKASVLGRVFTMRGTNFYINITCEVYIRMLSCGLFWTENTRMTCTRRVTPFVVFLPAKELKMENMTNKLLRFWSWIPCHPKLVCSFLKSSHAHSLCLEEGV